MDDEDKVNIENSNMKIEERNVHQSKSEVFILVSFGSTKYPVCSKTIALAMNLLENNTYKQVAEMTGVSVASLIRYRRAFKNKGKINYQIAIFIM